MSAAEIVPHPCTLEDSNVMRSRRPLLVITLLFIATSTHARLAPLEPLTPRATIGHYNGNLGINTPVWNVTNGDVPAAVTGAACPAPAIFGPLVGNPDNAKTVGGQTWGPILDIGTCTAGIGAGVVYMRTGCFNGPTLTLTGGCMSELLITGGSLAVLQVPHNGVILNIPNQLIPLSAIGAPWAAQVLVRGTSGTAELSTVLYGVVDACF
jgi:hypothetical protein